MNYTSTFTSVEDLDPSGYSSIDFKVKGYWSSSPITLYVRRNIFKAVEDVGTWSVDISHSSGGRDSKEVATDAEAVRYFAEAMIAAADLADMIMSNADVLEQRYQDYRAKQKAEFEAERAAVEAKKEADVPLGEVKATALVARMVAGEISQVACYARGSDRPSPLTCTIRMKAKLYFNGGIIAKKDAIAMLTNASARTHVII